MSHILVQASLRIAMENPWERQDNHQQPSETMVELAAAGRIGISPVGQVESDDEFLHQVSRQRAVGGIRI